MTQPDRPSTSWQARYETALAAYANPTVYYHANKMSAALRAAFPEYAPQHAPTESESDDN